jgi:hypothetical protein
VTDPADRAGIFDYMWERAVFPLAYHVGNLGRSVRQILAEQDLRRALEASADALATRLSALTPALVEENERRDIEGQREFAWAFTPPRGLSWSERVGPKIQLAAAVAVAVPLGLLLSPLVALSVALLRKNERSDPVWSGQADMGHVQTLLAGEDEPDCVMNHLVNVSPMKPGLLRAATIRIVLGAINLVARAVYTRGALGDITSIHFAHWSLIDDGSRLLFVSNFDGSWESYLGDFIDKAAPGLTAIWSNTVDFPRTEFLIQGGARHERAFKAIARARQIPTLVWYRAYRSLSVQNVDDNSAARLALCR